MFWRRELLDHFPIAPILDSGEYYKLKLASRKNLEKGFIVVLIFFIFLFFISKKMDFKPRPIKIDDPAIFMIVEDVPITKQGSKRRRPPRPVVPIPVEEPTVPDDLTIEPTEIDFSLTPPDMPFGDGFAAVVPPRPIADVFPEYPETEKEKGVEGEIELSLLVDESGKVKNVTVVKNSTKSVLCQESAIKAAYQTQFSPAKKNKQYVAVWIRKTYKFYLNKNE